MRSIIYFGAIFFLLASPSFGADENAEIVRTIKRWGLLGTWATDCSGPPAVHVSYAIDPDGKPVYRNSNGTSDIVAAARNDDGTLSITIRTFGTINESRVNVVQRDGKGIKSIMNRNDRNEYSIRDGIFVHTGKPTLPLNKCS